MTYTRVAAAIMFALTSFMSGCGINNKTVTIKNSSTPGALRFGLAADTNISNSKKTAENWRTMIMLAEKNELDFILIAGDIVNNARQTKQWDHLKTLMGEHKLKIETVPGNHEARIIHEDRSNVFNRIFSLDRYKNTTGNATNRAFCYANAYFITMYSGGLSRGDVDWAKFLKTQLALAANNDTIDWIFIVDHFDPDSVCFPHAFPKFGGFDRAKLIKEAISDYSNVIWLSGDLSSKYQHKINEDAPPYAEFIPRENRSSPGFWRFDVDSDGNMTAQIVEYKGTNEDVFIKINAR